MADRRTVLLAEDNEDHAFLTRRALETVGAAVVVAPGGPEAISLVRDWQGPLPDLVILDLSMPMVDGLEVLAAIRGRSPSVDRDPAWHHTPAVILSTSRFSRDIAAAYAAGANSYVCKPSSPSAYRAALSSLGQYWLSLNAATESEGGPPQAAPARPGGSPPVRQGDEPRRILFAEDNEDHAFLIRRALGPTGAELVHAPDGEEALRLLEHWEGAPPAFVLLDMNMPRKNGLEVLDRIRSGSRHARVPVVIFSTSRLPADVRRAYELQANSYISKPQAFGEFREVLGLLSEYWVIVNEV